MIMSDGPKENLNDRFGKFPDPEQAEQAVEDIRRGEQLLHEHTAPKPDSELRADIKAEIAVSLLSKKQNAFRGMAYKTMAVAAGFIILAIIGVKLFETDSVQPESRVSSSIMPKAVWDSDCLADDGADSATLVAEIEQIEREVLALRLDEN